MFCMVWVQCTVVARVRACVRVCVCVWSPVVVKALIWWCAAYICWYSYFGLVSHSVTVAEISGVQKSLVELDDIVASVMCFTYMSHHTVLALKKYHPPILLTLALR
jgi:hypothetical protein